MKILESSLSRLRRLRPSLRAMMCACIRLRRNRGAISEACAQANASGAREEIIAFCRGKSLSIACAESCTGGLVANTLTDVPGASTCFLGGIVAYSAEVKTSRLGVPPQTIEKFGVVSEECAKAMAEGALKIFGADFAVSTTGVAGPGAQDGINAGTVCVAVATPSPRGHVGIPPRFSPSPRSGEGGDHDSCLASGNNASNNCLGEAGGTQAKTFFFEGEPRERVKVLATEAALSMLLNALREQA